MIQQNSENQGEKNVRTRSQIWKTISIVAYAFLPSGQIKFELGESRIRKETELGTNRFLLRCLERIPSHWGLAGSQEMPDRLRALRIKETCVPNTQHGLQIPLPHGLEE